MKKQYACLVFLVCFCFSVSSQQVIVTDDATYTTPASGAVLDVKSTSKGFMPPRVALTGRTDASTIPSPAPGLMIFNTVSAGSALDSVNVGYYYNAGTAQTPSWTRLLNSDVVNGFSFNTDGSPLLNGDATNWDDLKIPFSAPSNGSLKPDWAKFPYGETSSAPYLNWFKSAGVDEMYFVVQMPHNWKEGTSIMPHIHWTPSASGTGAVRWALQYVWTNIGSEFLAYTTIYGTTTVPSEILVKSKHYLTSLGTGGIDGTGKTFSSMLVCRIFRDGDNSADDYNGLAGALEFDFHYQIDAFGTRDEYLK